MSLFANTYSLAEENLFPFKESRANEAAMALSFAFANPAPERSARSPDRQAWDYERFNSAILRTAPDCIIAIDHTGTILSFNPAAERAFGMASDAAVGKSFAATFIAADQRAQLWQNIALCLAPEASQLADYRLELWAVRADGSPFPAELAIVPLGLPDGGACTLFLRDISEKKRADMLQAGQNRVLNLIATGTSLNAVLDEIIRLAEQQLMRAACTVSRLSEEDGLPGQTGRGRPFPHSAIAQPGQATSFSSHRPRLAESGAEPVRLTERMHAAQGAKAWKRRQHTSIYWPILGKTRRLLGTLACHFHGATAPTAAEEHVAGMCAELAGIAIERLAQEENIRYLAHYDVLTALPNRFLFSEYLDLALSNARRSNKKFAVLFVDLDKFKEINDTLGHDAGDRVLREIATRMRHCLRHTDKIARMGGDEFYVLIEELKDARHAAEVAQKLLEAAARPVEIAGEARHLSASIGIGVYPGDGKDGDTLLRNADCAMYRAKRMGKNRYQFYSLPGIPVNVA